MKAKTLLSLITFLLSTQLFANTYNVQWLDSDAGRYFYGMDDIGHTVFLRTDTNFCSSSYSDCYETFSDGSLVGFSSAAPTFNWDFVKGACDFANPYPCSLSDNGNSVVMASFDTVYYGTNLSQVLHGMGFGGIFAINGVGDIVLDDEFGDLWLEIIDPPSPPAVPEPSSIVLIGLGVIASVKTWRRHRGSNPDCTLERGVS